MTDLLGGAVRNTPDYNKAFADMTTLGRACQPHDIRPMVAGLLGPDNRRITAQRIKGSGGQNILRRMNEAGLTRVIDINGYCNI